MMKVKKWERAECWLVGILLLTLGITAGPLLAADKKEEPPSFKLKVASVKGLMVHPLKDRLHSGAAMTVSASPSSKCASCSASLLAEIFSPSSAIR